MSSQCQRWLSATDMYAASGNLLIGSLHGSGIVRGGVARIDVRHPGELVNPELVARRVAVLTRRAIPLKHLPHRRHLNHRHVDHAQVDAVARRHEPVVDRRHVREPLHHVSRQVVHDDGGGGGGAGEHHLADRQARQRVVGALGLHQRPDLGDDLAGLTVRRREPLVALGVELGEALRRARQDLEADVAFRHRVGVREVKHPRVAARVHGFGQDQPAEPGVVRRPPDDNARPVGLPVGRTADEVLLRHVAEVGEVVARLQFHQRLEKLSRTGYFRRRRRDCRHHRRRVGRGRLLRSPATAALAGRTRLRGLRRRLAAALSLYRDRQLSRYGDRLGSHDDGDRCDGGGPTMGLRHEASPGLNPVHILAAPRDARQVPFEAAESGKVPEEGCEICSATCGSLRRCRRHRGARFARCRDGGSAAVLRDVGRALCRRRCSRRHGACRDLVCFGLSCAKDSTCARSRGVHAGTRGRALRTRSGANDSRMGVGAGRRAAARRSGGGNYRLELRRVCGDRTTSCQLSKLAYTGRVWERHT